MTFLVEGLKVLPEKVLEMSAERLGEIGPEAAEAIPALQALLVDGSNSVRAAALRSLREVGAPRDAWTPALLEMVRSEYWSLTMGTLTEAAGEDRGILEAACGLLKDSDPEVRIRGLWVLAAVPPSVPVPAAILEETVSDPDRREKMVPILREALRSLDPESLEEAARALGRLGAAAREAAPDLARAAIRYFHEEVRAVAARALAAAGPEAREAVPALEAMARGRGSLHSAGFARNPEVSNQKSEVSVRTSEEAAARQGFVKTCAPRDNFRK